MRAPKLAVLSWVAAAALCGAAPPAGAKELTNRERSFLRAVNDARTGRSLPRVLLVDRLERAARIHSSQMLDRQYFSHWDFPSRLWELGARGPVVGEDLGWSVDDG